MNTCISPEEIEAWELEAYLQGDTPVRVVQHVARCPGCSARVDELQRLHQRMQSVLARVDCPPAETLLQHRWRQLPAGRAREIDAHLARCRVCQSEFAAFIGPEPGPAEQLLTKVRKGLTMLTAICQPPLALAPVQRGAENPPIIYHVPETDWEIVLTQTTGARGHVLFGQLLGADAEDLDDARAGILADDQLLLAAAVDPTGWFALQPLPVGRYTLWIDVSATHIRAPGVVVGSEATAPP